jgi:LPXTG-motif cell wall-anchored protein
MEEPDGDREDGAQSTSETIPADELLVASHKDLTDADQTVLLRQPEEPEGPTEPGKPLEPEKTEEDGTSVRTGTGTSGRRKVTPASPDTVSVSTVAPGTGDDTNIWLYLFPALAAAAGAAGILLWKRKKGKNRNRKMSLPDT